MSALITMIALPVVAFLIGSIPFSLLIVRWVRGVDVRRIGSGNIGATNVRRAAGTLWGIVALICDGLKGAVPTYAAGVLQKSSIPELAAVVALAAVCGHMFPVFFRFKPSGKGVATALGAFAILSPPACGIALLVFIGVVLIVRRVSAASLSAMTAMPAAIALTRHSPITVIIAVLIAGLIVFRHKDNIRRLIRGEEPPIGKSN
jgi:glycerol-3-phosphate acyltransferase PlsY